MGKTKREEQHKGGKARREQGEEMTFSLREKVQEATEGKVFGPECVVCHEAIDVRSNRKNGNITQGFAHEECLPWAERDERDAAIAEDAEQIETEELLAQLTGMSK